MTGPNKIVKRQAGKDSKGSSRPSSGGALCKTCTPCRQKKVRCDGTRRHWMLRGKALLPKSAPQLSATGDDSFLRAEGESLKMVGVCIDISERKVAEEQLRASQQPAVRIFLETWFGKND